MADILHSLRRILFGWMNREFFIFLFFLVVAGVFWLLTTLNESFEHEVKVPLHFVNVPKDVVITSGDADTLRVVVRDKGISLVTYVYGGPLQPVDINFSRYDAANGSGTVPATDIQRLVASRLPASARTVSVKPETEVFFYNNGQKKRVPVQYQGKVEAEPRYFISEVRYLPDSVTIYAVPSKLDSISRVYTEALRLPEFRDTLTVSASLQRIEGVKMVPPQVGIRFTADMLTEASIDNVPIVGINMPAGKVLRTFPAKIAVSFTTGMKNYQHISASDFLIVADYDEISASDGTQCNIYLRRQPDGIQRVRMATQHVDYLIEEHNP